MIYDNIRELYIDPEGIPQHGTPRRIIPTGRISCSPPSFTLDVSAAHRHLKLIELNIEEDLKKEVDRNNFLLLSGRFVITKQTSSLLLHPGCHQAAVIYRKIYR